MPRVLGVYSQPFGESIGFVVWDIAPERERGGYVFVLIKGQRASLSAFLFNKLQRVFKHKARESVRFRCTQNFAPETVGNKLRNTPYVVDMSVGNQQKINRGGVIEKRFTIFVVREVRALHHTTINQNF